MLGLLKILNVTKFSDVNILLEIFWYFYKSSRSQLFYGIAVLKNFASFCGKQLQWCSLKKDAFAGTEAAHQRCSWEKVLWKYAANLQENIMPKCDFNKVALQLCNFIKFTLRHVCSTVNFLHIFITPFPRNTSWWLLLQVFSFELYKVFQKSFFSEHLHTAAFVF